MLQFTYSYYKAYLGDKKPVHQLPHGLRSAVSACARSDVVDMNSIDVGGVPLYVN